MQQRYYDPIIGRFYSNDPVDTISHLNTPNGTHGFNRYAYANNNPYKYIDPTGMSSYGAQQMSVTMAPNEKSAKAIHASYTTPRTAADTASIAVGALVMSSGAVVPGAVMMAEGISGKSLVVEGLNLIPGVDGDMAEVGGAIYDVGSGIKGIAGGLKKIGDNFSPETSESLGKAATMFGAESVEAGLSIDAAKETIQNYEGSDEKK